MDFNFEDWRNRLEKRIVQALAHFRPQMNEPMRMFSVDCHPWHGRIGLAFLSEKAAEVEPFLNDAEEMAGWDHFNFADKDFFFETVGREMWETYDQASPDHDKIAIEFLRQVAQAVASDGVQEKLKTFRQARHFKITITHPDTGREFFRR